MTRRFTNRKAMVLAALALPFLAAPSSAQSEVPEGAQRPYVVDPAWPKELPHKWLVGDVAGVNLDKDGDVWIVHRPATLHPYDVRAEDPLYNTRCCVAAPPVIEFDDEGNVLRAWGGPAEIEDWFDSEHAIFVDDEDHVWILGAGATDGQLLKFDMDGKLLLRIGRKGPFVAANDTTMLGMPTDMYVDTARREVFVSDGYRNHRLIVFDADTGAFKRQWTAYGKPVDPAWGSAANEIGSSGPKNQPDIFTTVHCVTMIAGELYVCDRSNNRIQVFTPEGQFVRELRFNEVGAGAAGSTWDAAPVPGHPELMLVLDGNNSEFALIDTKTAEVKGRYMSGGRWAGRMHWPHQAAVDEQLRLYVAEVAGSMRVQRFLPVMNFDD